MAVQSSTLGVGGLKRYRNWLSQYRATHGTMPAQQMMDSFLTGEIQARMNTLNDTRRLGFEEKNINSLIASRNEAAANERKRISAEENAARTDALLQTGMLAYLGRDELKAAYTGAKGLLTKGAGAGAASAGTAGGAASGAAAGEFTSTFAGQQVPVNIGTSSAGTVSSGASTAGGGLSTTAAGGGPTGSSMYGGLAAAGIIAGDTATKNWQQEQLGETTSEVMTVAAYAGAGFMVAGPAGAVVGGVIGVAKVATGTVLCTELHRQGKLPTDIYLADSAYGKTVDPYVYEGYVSWAAPIAEKMKTSKVLTAIMCPIVKPWAYHAAYKMGVYHKDNYVGRFLEYAGSPICKAIGYLRSYKWQTS